MYMTEIKEACMKTWILNVYELSDFLISQKSSVDLSELFEHYFLIKQLSFKKYVT